MVEPKTHYIPQAYIHSDDSEQDLRKGGVNFTLRIERVSVSNAHMSRSMIELPCGGCATESEALSALAREAKRRKTSYGLLVANTTGRERAEIIRDYCADKGRKRKKG